jgi:hypothetical protein
VCFYIVAMLTASHSNVFLQGAAQICLCQLHTSRWHGLFVPNQCNLCFLCRRIRGQLDCRPGCVKYPSCFTLCPHVTSVPSSTASVKPSTFSVRSSTGLSALSPQCCGCNFRSTLALESPILSASPSVSLHHVSSCCPCLRTCFGALFHSCFCRRPEVVWLG